MIVAAHQPNFLPACSVIDKARHADLLILLTGVEYSAGSYINRNRLADDQPWLTVPVDRATAKGPIRDVLVAEHTGWREKIARTLEQQLGDTQPVRSLANAVRLHTRHAPLWLLSLQTWDIILATLGDAPKMTVQSVLDSITEDPSVRLARLVEKHHGTVYLSGAGGRKYLSEKPFKARGIEVRYQDFDGPNPSAATLLREAVPA